ncbi:hypothetical protein IIY66_01415 [Candidatus Saccharibacteria bacterium]|nr:hypothetical protein [Candidatus Saccharibacteria bacterium]
MKKKQSKVYLFPAAMLGITATAGMIANIPGANADDNSAIDDTINITVDSSCTMGQTVTSAHTTELNPGETNTTIGESRIAAYCNDNEGYAIYAIGYTNSEYGNTNLVSTDGNHTIPTGTSGNNSYWNMRLTQGTATGPTSYLPTMVNEFTTSTTIPNDYTKVAYRDSSTISQTEDPAMSGSYFTTTYAAHIDTAQPAGIYNGQVQYVMVHPSGAPAPEKPLVMQDTASIKRKLVNVGDTAQATDKRDGKKYWITKLADGNIWMTQNLDLDIEAGRTYTSTDTDLANSTIGTSWTPTVSTSTTSSWTNSKTAPASYNPGNLYWNGNVTTSGGNLSDRTTTDPSATSGGTHYHVGNYYNWTAAVAMNISRSYTSSRRDVNQSICPAGWRLPTYSGDKSYLNLKDTQGLTAGTSGNIQSTPTYFVYGGYWNGSSSSVGRDGRYWSSVVNNSNYAYLLYFAAYGDLYPQNGDARNYGYSVRCVAR